MYYGHNLHFIAISGAMDGDYAAAHAAALKLYRHVSPYIKEMPLVEAYMTIDPVIDVRFHRWEDVLKIPTPDPSLKMLTAIWHYSRGMAFAGKGKIADALVEHKALAAIEQATPADADFTPLNKAKAVLTVADNTLAAKIAMARGKTEDAIAKLRAAVAAQDALNYDEPPDWYFPVRESLGAALLKSGDAAGAEKVFREDLDRNPRNPRSLFGLAQALKKEGHAYDAQFVDAEFHRAWKGDPGRLTISDLI
jgi:tetratricopeptide (TPR) repeat protein